eukprot:scaffold1.g5724.t1
MTDKQPFLPPSEARPADAPQMQAHAGGPAPPARWWLAAAGAGDSAAREAQGLALFAISTVCGAGMSLAAKLAVFVALLGPLVLGEPTGRGVLLAAPPCLAGVVLVARPTFLFGGGAGVSAAGVGVGLVQALFSASAKMCVRALSGSKERMACIIFSMGAVSTAGAVCACLLLRTFVLPTSLPVYLLLIANGLCGYGNQVLLTAALQRAKASPAIAMSYLSVVWGFLADVVVFHVSPSALSLLGTALICSSSALLAWEQRRARGAAGAAKAKASGGDLARLLDDGMGDGVEDARGGWRERIAAYLPPRLARHVSPAGAGYERVGGGGGAAAGGLALARLSTGGLGAMADGRWEGAGADAAPPR